MGFSYKPTEYWARKIIHLVWDGFYSVSSSWAEVCGSLQFRRRCWMFRLRSSAWCNNKIFCRFLSRFFLQQPSGVLVIRMDVKIVSDLPAVYSALPSEIRDFLYVGSSGNELNAACWVRKWGEHGGKSKIQKTKQPKTHQKVTNCLHCCFPVGHLCLCWTHVGSREISGDFPPDIWRLWSEVGLWSHTVKPNLLKLRLSIIMSNLRFWKLTDDFNILPAFVFQHKMYFGCFNLNSSTCWLWVRVRVSVTGACRFSFLSPGPEKSPVNLQIISQYVS